MTNDELKKKIAQIIADYFCPQRNEHKNLWGDDRLCYSKMNFAECEWVAECTDALIAAGLRFGENLTATFDHIALEREHELERRLAEAERHAEVAARMAKRACDIVFSQEIESEEWDEAIFNYKKDKGIGEIGITPNILYDYLKAQAEKELAEEGKDENY